MNRLFIYQIVRKFINHRFNRTSVYVNNGIYTRKILSAYFTIALLYQQVILKSE